MCQRCIVAGLLSDRENYTGSSESDDYEIEREIGRGGDGTVYLGFDRKVGRQVALKLIKSMRGGSEAIERRFRTEVEAIASLDHPNIIPIYANGELDGRLFYSMKYVSGGSLATRMDEFTTPLLVADLISKLARAVHHAHERGVLHRDLKPSNILLDEAMEPFISDFGLAKRTEQNLDLTVTGSIMGTPAYMSPEQARGDNSQVTTTSDVFSLGSIFYQLLTGSQAFNGDVSHIVLRNVIETEVDLSQLATCKIDRDLETICLKCLEKDPGKRYQSALALSEDLERWEKGEPVEARRITPLEMAIRWIRRYPVLVSTLVIAMISLVGGTIVSVTQWQQAEKAREAAERTRLTAEAAKLVAEENEYHLTVANALSDRERFEFGEARRLLDSVDPARRGFEWRLVKGLSRGDQDWSVGLGDAKPLHLVRDDARDRIVLLTSDRRLHEVDPETGGLTPTGKLPDTPGGSSVDIRHPGLLHFAFAPDGRHYSFIDGQKLIIVDLASQEIAFYSGDGDNLSAASTATWLDSNRLLTAGSSFYSVVGGDGKFRVSAWYYDLARKEKGWLPPKGWVGPLATSPDGSRVAIGRSDQTLEIYRIDSDFKGEPEFKSPPVSAGKLDKVRFSPDGRYLGIAWKGTRSIVQVHDLQIGKRLMGQFWPTKPDIVFSEDSKTLFIMGRESWFTSWKFGLPRSQDRVFNDGHPSGESYEQEGPFGPPGSLLTRNTGDHRTTFFFGHHAPVVSSLSLSGTGELLTAGSDGSLKKWSLPAVSAVIGRRDPVASAHEYFHPTASQNGQFALYRNSEKGNRHELWQVPGGRVTPVPEGYTGLAIFNDGRVLARDDESLEIVCWQADGKGVFQELWKSLPEGSYPGSGTYFVHSSTTPDERFVSILLWGRFLTVDMAERKCRIVKDQVMVRGSSPGQSTAISPDGRFMAVTGFMGPKARIYQVRDPGGEQYRVLPATNYVTKDSACVYSHDGTRLYVGNNDGWVRVFEVPTLAEIPSESWQAHSSEVTAIALSQGGEIVATAGGEKIILWSSGKRPNQARRRRLSLRTGTVPRNWIHFGGGDARLLHSGPARPIEVWEAPKSTRLLREVESD